MKTETTGAAKTTTQDAGVATVHEVSKMGCSERALFTMAETLSFRQESCRSRVLDELRRIELSARHAIERIERNGAELYSGSFSSVTPELKEMAGQADAIRETVQSLKFLAKKMDEASGGTDATRALELALAPRS